MATTAQIIQTAAENLGILGEGEVLPSYENGDLTQAVAEVHSELRLLGLTTWASTSDVPDEYARSFADLVAESRAVKYKIPDEQFKRIMFKGDTALMRIRKLQSKQKVGVTQIESM